MAGYQEIPHSEACLKHREYIKDVLARADMWKWTFAWYCWTCKGSGVVMTDPGDASVGMSAEYGYCEDCVLKGTCPRCGGQHGNIITHETEPSDFFTCGQCGYVLDGNQECLANMTASIEGVPDCICEEERYETWRALHPPTRHEEALNMGMSDAEAQEYERTGDLPDSYLARADFEYDAQRERRTWGRF